MLGLVTSGALLASGRIGSMMIDMSGETPFIIRTSEAADAFFYDITSSTLYMLN